VGAERKKKKKATLNHTTPFLFLKESWKKTCRFYNLPKKTGVLSLVCMSNTDGETRVMQFSWGHCITFVVLLSDVCMSRELPKIAPQEISQGSVPRESLKRVVQDSSPRMFSSIEFPTKVVQDNCPTFGVAKLPPIGPRREQYYL